MVQYSVTAAALLVLCLSARALSQMTEPQVPCFFIFGDSLVDNGNNNRMVTLAKANYRPYGIDFPQGPTGRFTNGRTFVDVLAELLGFQDYIPPYSEARGPYIIRGVNFASGAAGIRDETGNNLGGHVAMNQQVANFGRVVATVISRFFRGDTNAVANHLNKCIYYAGMGSNDYLNNYFMPTVYSTASQFTPEAYASALLQDYSRQLTELYRLGARKVIVTAVGQIGCIPYQLARFNSSAGKGSRCNEEINEALNLFNVGLKRMVDRFNRGQQLPGATFVYLDAYQSTKDLYSHGNSYGFTMVDRGCCGVGKNNGEITCLPSENPCENRAKYLFWDAFHPTEVANIMLAKTAYNTPSRTYAYPINVKQLAML